MAHLQAFSATTLLILYLRMLTLIQFASSNSIGFSLKLIPRGSPESPLYFGNISQSEKMHRIFQLSKARAYNLNPDNLRLFVSRDDRYYTVKLHIGTPGIPLSLVLDTGSGLTWTQCKPCVNCYRQVTPIYDSRASHTYRPVPCSHPVCQNRRLFNCVNQKCVYNVEFLGGGTTRGVVSLETFKFLPNTSIPMAFGCSSNNQNFGFGRTGKIGGILGLDMTPESLVLQLGRLISHRFSYCLVPFNEASTVPSFLRFGNDIVTHGRNFQSTAFVNHLNDSHYYLNLVDISIAGRHVRIPPGTFTLNRDGSGGFIIDSGSVATFLVENAYRLVMPFFEQYYARFHLRRINGPFRGYHLCYRYNPNFRSYASMTFHFRGADLHVQPAHVYLFDHEDGVFCVALLPNRRARVSILGSLHQQNTRFIYDISRRQLQFAPENCLSDINQ